MPEGQKGTPPKITEECPQVKESGFRAVFAKLRKRRIIETLAAFIGGGWLLVEVVERLLVGHYHVPEEAIDLTVVSVIGALLATLVWRWFRGTEKRPGNVKVEVLIVPLIILAALAIDLNLILQVAGIQGKKLLIGIVALCFGIVWVLIKLYQWAARTPEAAVGKFDLSERAGISLEKSIVVLPFADLSPEKDQEYFCDGLAEDIIDALTQVPGLRVMARTSSFAFRGKEEDVREIGARLNVENILEGSVRRAGSRIRVTAQLVKASDGYHLWSQRFDREMTDVFAIQDEISKAIVEKLRLRLAGARPLVKRYTENLVAYDLCLKARYHLLKMTQEGREAGRRYCEQAIALDPNYALAYVVLSESYLWSLYWGSSDPREAYPMSKSAALQALRLDDTIADAHSALGTVLGSGEFDWHGAEREFVRAQEISPSSVAVRYGYAWCYALWFLFPQGRVEEALAEMRSALELDPLDPFYNTLVGYLLHCLRQSEAAVKQQQHAIDLDPTFFFAHWLLAVTYVNSGRFEEAIVAAERANELSGGNPLTLGTLGSIYGRAGRAAEARRVLDELTARRRSAYVPASALAWAHFGAGALDRGLEWMARGVEERDPLLVTGLRGGPTYDRLRSFPAYQALLRKMNLES
jgi:TolB-like protein/Tfp pilus assembly protein PilF